LGFLGIWFFVVLFFFGDTSFFLSLFLSYDPPSVAGQDEYHIEVSKN